jgi:hypothetical protein
MARPKGQRVPFARVESPPEKIERRESPAWCPCVSRGCTTGKSRLAHGAEARPRVDGPKFGVDDDHDFYERRVRDEAGFVENGSANPIASADVAQATATRHAPPQGSPDACAVTAINKPSTASEAARAQMKTRNSRLQSNPKPMTTSRAPKSRANPARCGSMYKRAIDSGHRINATPEMKLSAPSPSHRTLLTVASDRRAVADRCIAPGRPFCHSGTESRASGEGIGRFGGHARQHSGLRFERSRGKEPM